MKSLQPVFMEVLEEAVKGGDFAEIFVEEEQNTALTCLNGKVEEATSNMEYGLGLRVYNGFHSVYTYTSDLSKDNLLKMARQAAIVSGGAVGQAADIFVPYVFTDKHPVKEYPADVNKEEKIDVLKRAHKAGAGYSDEITQTRTKITDRDQQVCICNSEGLFVTDRRIYTRLMFEMIASSKNEKQSGYFAPGRHQGFEFVRALDIEELAKEAAKTAVTMLHADVCPSGKMPVVIDKGFGGVIFHEACGHSLEATSVARKASVFHDKLGKMIASPILTAIDDGTISHAWGSTNVDDEGTPTRKNVLIENGVLKSFLVDRLNGRRMGVEPTGSGRRQNYRFAPTSRMNNTFIAGGDDTKEDIFASIDYGIYAKNMGGGSVQPATGDFNFAVLEAYMIRNGKIAEPVRGATLIGKGNKIIKDIDMISEEVVCGQGMCGSVSGSVPVDAGQALLRVKEITVGGRG